MAFNKLQSVPAAVFASLTQLNMLYLDSNRITSLPATVFTNNKQLAFLCVHASHIALDQHKYTVATVNISSMDRRKLANNSLTALPDTVFHSLTLLQTL